MNPKSFDIAIIGAGSAGFAAARTAAGLGLKTALLESGPEVGGLCILHGCMPAKTLLYAAEMLHQVRRAHTWGLHAHEIGFDFDQVMARKNALIETFAAYRRDQLEHGAFKWIRAAAKFADPHTLALDNGQTLAAKHFVICTGSMVSPPPLATLRQTGYITSDQAMSLAKLPKSLLVLGGGPVAIELAQFFARFNVKVTVVQRSRHILKTCDDDAAEALEKVLRREGIALFTDTKLVDAWREGLLKGVSFQHQNQIVRIAAEEILLALGRSPNTDALDLENAGVYTDNGRIITNTEMQTTSRHIYAAGDCTGPHEIVHVAVQQGEIAGHNIAHPAKKKSLDYRLLSQVVFTEPQVAQVGLTEKEAKIRKIPYLAASYPFNDHGKSLIMETLDGFVKLLADPKTGEILGGSAVGPLTGELIHEIVAAMHHRMTVKELALMPHYHPTLAEIWTYPAEELAEKV
jgi:pyruvate/2-oxoglutarate dehydrogenase complex dihydrolipoamide dehydrogenase (E3) component